MESLKQHDHKKCKLNTSISELALPPRVKNLLLNQNYHPDPKSHIRTVADLINKTDEELLKIPNFGKKSLHLVKEALIGKFVY